MTSPAAPVHQMSGYGCRVRRSTQHFVEVYSRESGILEFFWDVGSSAARLGRGSTPILMAVGVSLDTPRDEMFVTAGVTSRCWDSMWRILRTQFHPILEFEKKHV